MEEEEAEVEVVVVEVVVVEVVVEVAYSISVLVLLTLLQAASTHTQSVQPSVKSQLCSAGLSFTPQPRAVWLVAVSATENHNDLKLDKYLDDKYIFRRQIFRRDNARD